LGECSEVTVVAGIACGGTHTSGSLEPLEQRRAIGSPPSAHNACPTYELEKATPAFHRPRRRFGRLRSEVISCELSRKRWRAAILRNREKLPAAL
jgi:hypothetical protein